MPNEGNADHTEGPRRSLGPRLRHAGQSTERLLRQRWGATALLVLGLLLMTAGAFLRFRTAPTVVQTSPRIVASALPRASRVAPAPHPTPTTPALPRGDAFVLVPLLSAGTPR